MELAVVQFSVWEKPQYFKLTDQNKLKVDDWLIVESEYGSEIGKLVKLKDFSEKELAELEINPEELNSVKCKAGLSDLRKLEALNDKKWKIFNQVTELVKKHNLPMKMVDLRIAFDEKRLIFAFIADGRVDFRELVKDLTNAFNKLIRLQQIGIRDEAKLNGDLGHCGRNLCCQTYLHELGNVNSDFAEVQQISHRGSERLSGICGRLKCCLAYEKDLYEALAAKLPEIGKRINTKRGKGTVTRHHVLRQKVELRLESDEDTIIEVSLDEIKK